MCAFFFLDTLKTLLTCKNVLDVIQRGAVFCNPIFLDTCMYCTAPKKGMSVILTFLSDTLYYRSNHRFGHFRFSVHSHVAK